jgi:hypothetical protein
MISCPGPACPFCTGEACRTCAAANRPFASCWHDKEERHAAPNIDQPNGERDELADEPAESVDEPDEPIESRVPTRPMLAARVICEFGGDGDGEDVAVLLETMAKIIRSKRRLIVIAE